MKRSEHLDVVAGKYLKFFPLSVNGLKYVIDSSHVFEDGCPRMVYEAGEVFIDRRSHRELYVVDKGDEWRSYWVEDSCVIGANCCPIRSISDFLREKDWKIGTYGFAKDKFPLIVPFHEFNPGNIGGSLQHNVVKQQ